MFLLQRQINVIILLVKEQCFLNCRGCAIWLSDTKEKVLSHMGHVTDQILLHFVHWLPLVYSGCFLFWFGFFLVCLLGVPFLVFWGFLFLNGAFLFTPAKHLWTPLLFCVYLLAFCQKHKSMWHLLTLRQCLCPRAVQWVLGRLLSGEQCGIRAVRSDQCLGHTICISFDFLLRLCDIIGLPSGIFLHWWETFESYLYLFIKIGFSFL